MINECLESKETDNVNIKVIESEFISSSSSIKQKILESALIDFDNIMNRITKSLYETFNNTIIKSSIDYVDDEFEDYLAIKNILESKLKRSEVEWGLYSEFDEFVINNISNENVLKAINEIYINNYNDENVLLKILSALSAVDYDKVRPYGQTIAIAAVANKNILVKQKAIETFESWNNLESLKILESLDITTKWLKKHVDKIIRDLKEEVETNA